MSSGSEEISSLIFTASFDITNQIHVTFVFSVMLQNYSGWEIGAADVRTPAVHISRTDYLHSYGRAVADVTQELCDLVLHSYSEKMSMLCKSGKLFSYHLPNISWIYVFLNHLWIFFFRFLHDLGVIVLS